jgi:hypothetical protein
MVMAKPIHLGHTLHNYYCILPLISAVSYQVAPLTYVALGLIIARYISSERSEKQSKFGECLLPFSSESFVFLSLLQQVRQILLFVLYGCETWSLTLSKEHRLRVPENRMVRRIFRPKREEVVGCWRRLHN